MRVVSVVSVALLATLAGCSGKGDSQDANASTSALETAVTDLTGGIEGTVTDEAGLPLSGVEILLRPGENTTSSDEAGHFAFGGLAPGDYELWAGALGYESHAQVVAVVAGETATVTVALAQVSVVVPFAETATYSGHITAGEAFVDIITGSFGLPGCDECNQVFHANETVLSVVLELSFKPTLSNPSGTTTLEYQLWDKSELESGDLEAEPYASGAWTDGSKIQLDKAKWASKWDPAGDDFRMVHYCATEWVCVDQRFTVFTTLFHHQEAPADFTALETDEG